MAKRFIITPISGNGTIGQSILIYKKSKTESAMEGIGVLLVSSIFVCMALFVLRSAIEVYW